MDQYEHHSYWSIFCHIHPLLPLTCLLQQLDTTYSDKRGCYLLPIYSDGATRSTFRLHRPDLMESEAYPDPCHKRKGNSMLKLARLGAATVLSLLIAATLLVPGAFAQRVDAHHGSATLSANRVVATAVLTSANQVAHTTTSQQAVQPLSMKWGGWGGGGWGGGWGGWGGGWGNGWYGGGWGGCGC